MRQIANLVCGGSKPSLASKLLLDFRLKSLYMKRISVKEVGLEAAIF